MACGLLTGAVWTAGAAAVGIWCAAVVAFVALVRGYSGPKSRLIFSSMWLLTANSLGPTVEPLRRRLAKYAGLFFLAVIASVVLSILGAAVSCS
ncbi:hypothetical protein BH10PSE9_BH10PSE9_01380 [soil metagenome]